MAHTKSGGSTKNGRDSIAKRLGVKIQHGNEVAVGQVIVRQRGTRYYPGKNVGRAADDTLFALKNGAVQFAEKTKRNFDRSTRKVTVVTVL